MSSLKNSIMAKSSDGGWLPLWMHHKDTAGVIAKLSEHYVSSSFFDSVHENKELVIKTAEFIAMVHDIGKAAIFFQYKIMSGSDNPGFIQNELKSNIKWYNTTKQNVAFKHAIIGEVILNKFACPSCVSAVVGAHHGIPANAAVENRSLNEDWKDIEDNTEIYGYRENIDIFNKIWSEIIAEALSFSGFNNINELPENLSKSAQTLLSGILIMADWIASNTDCFPLITNSEFDYENIYPDRIETGWAKINLPDKWTSKRKNYADEEFKNSFGFLPNSIQKEILSTVENSVKPGLYILEAPMGIGKTEAALASGEILAEKYNKCGLFFGMPTQATANGLFPRIEAWGENLSKDEIHTIQLRHSSAELNDEFRRIKENIPDEYDETGLRVHSWFCNSKKACLSDFVIGCVDQLLMMALKRKHVMLLHLGLSEKVVVVDECHAYDAYMNQYLGRALEWLGAYGVPVILLSATLPAEKRCELLKAYSGKKVIPDEIAQSEVYPLLTWSDGEIFQKELKYDGIHKTVDIYISTVDTFEQQAKKVLDSGGCVGIIVNTVKRAQMVLDKFKNYRTILYHAQFLLPDRTEKESEMLKLIGKKSTADDRKGLCVVGTQVLEQSLDIDFDLLITDIAPMDLLMQRIGRLHRHSRNDRPECATRPTCIVLTDELEKDSSGSNFIYTDWLLKTTRKLLPAQITLPDDISSLVQAVYKAKDENDKSFCKYENDIEILKEKAKAFRIERVKGKSIHGLLDREISDIEAEAGVRCGTDTVEVLALRLSANGKYYFLNGKVVPDNPDEYCYTEIARQKIRLPHTFAAVWNIEKTLEEIRKNKVDFLEKSYLTAGVPVLLFDDDCKTEINGYMLDYSYEYGLKYTEKGD